MFAVLFAVEEGTLCCLKADELTNEIMKMNVTHREIHNITIDFTTGGLWQLSKPSFHLHLLCANFYFRFQNNTRLSDLKE